MTPFFNKLSLLGLTLFAGLGNANAQYDQFVEIKFTPHGSSEKEIVKHVGEDAESFDITSYINQNLDKGEMLIRGRLHTELSHTKIRFDSGKITDKNANMCESVHSETKPFIGIGSTGMDDFSGVLLERIVEKSAAEDASFHAGDVISYIDDYEIRSVCDLLRTVKKLNVGQQVSVTYNDGGADKNKDVIVGSREVRQVSWKSCPATASVENPVIHAAVAAAPAYNVFPNPSTGVSNLTFEHDSTGELSIEIFDLNGKRIFAQDKIDFDHYYEDVIDIANQASGIYIVELRLNGQKFTKELVVHQN
jgi:hypothetical protein